MRKDRLMALADFLDKLPPERFDYSVWVGDDWKGAQDLSCGTTACALGWATRVPELQDCGLRFQPYKNRCGGYITDDTGRTDPIMVARDVFELTTEAAEYLFTPDSTYSGYPDAPWSPRFEASPSEVAAHIRKFVEASP